MSINTKAVAVTFPTVVRAEGDEPEIIINTAAVDREGDVVEPDGCELGDYLRNPVVGFGHFRTESMPIGATTSITREAGGLRAKFRWLTNDPLADRVRNAFEQGVLRAASVGFLPLAREPRRDGNGYRFTKWSLLEWSIVPIPANPDAVRVLRSLGLHAIEDDMVLELEEEPSVDGISHEALVDLVATTVRHEIAPLVARARELGVQPAPEPEIEIDPADLKSVLADSMRRELGLVVERETRRAINELRGRIDD